MNENRLVVELMWAGMDAIPKADAVPFWGVLAHRIQYQLDNNANHRSEVINRCHKYGRRPPNDPLYYYLITDAMEMATIRIMFVFRMVAGMVVHKGKDLLPLVPRHQ